ncbi:MAG: hemerythrin family protein [Gammaproteobacteria bacterium]|nr:hemerythrin family protein [Gammaproteobacteria bacterium]
MKKRRLFQKILMVIAMLSYLVAVGCGIAIGYRGVDTGDVVVASLMASVVFFIGVGIVLQVIGSANLPDLKIE